MDVTVEQKDLANELALASGMIDSKPTIPVLSCALLEARGQTLSIQATDLDTGLNVQLPARVAEEGVVAVPIKRLSNYVKLLPAAAVRMRTSGASEMVSISCGRAQTRIAGVSAHNFPQVPAMPAEMTKLKTRTLLLAIPRAAISIADQQSHYTLAGAKFVVGLDNVELVATDGHRLSVYSERREGVDESHEFEALISKKALLRLQRVLSLPQSGLERQDEEGVEESDAGSISTALVLTEVSQEKNNLFFRLGRRLFTCRKTKGRFPDHKRVMPRDLGISLKMTNGLLHGVLQRVQQFSDERARPVGLELADGRLTVKANHASWGSSEESLPVDYDGDTIEVGFNALYILDFLAACDSETVYLKLRDSQSAAQMEVPGMGGGDAPDFRYVIMPIRI